MALDRRTFLRSSAVAAATVVLSSELIGAAAADPPLTIVSNGTAAATIVIADDADAQTVHAAQELARYIDEATGALLPVETTTQAGAGIHLVVGVITAGSGVGAAEVSALAPDGFIIRRSGQQCSIVGRDGWGTRYGVYEFLERFLDVRWLMPDDLVPGQSGRDVPSRTDLSLVNADHTVEPAFAGRTLSPFPGGWRRFEQWDWYEDDRTSDWVRGQMTSWGNYARVRHRYEFSHNLFTVIKVAKYGDPSKPATYHPEFFPIVNGQTVIPQLGQTKRWQPRFSATGIAKAAANEVLDYLRAHPGTTSFSLSVNDAGGYSEDDYDPSKPRSRFGSRNASDAYYAFVNEVASLVTVEFPAVRLCLLAYQAVIEPPSFPLHPNVMPFLTRDLQGWVNDAVRERDHQWVEQWGAVANELGYWDYPRDNPYCVPRLYLREMAQAYSYLADQGVTAIMAPTFPGWGSGPKWWIYTKLLWDPTQSTARLLHEWCERAVGSRAAPDLMAYYRLWERFWTHDVPSSEWFDLSKWRIYLTFSDAGYLEALSEADVADARMHLERAQSRTVTAEQAGRVQVLAKWFDYYEASALSHPTRTAAPTGAASAISLIDQAAGRLDRNLGLAQSRSAMDLFHEGEKPQYTPSRFNMEWSGWNLYPVWDAAQYIRSNEPTTGPVRDHVTALANSTSSENVRRMALWVHAIADGNTIERGSNNSFESGTLAPWVLEGGTALVVTEAPRTGTHSVKIPAYGGTIRQSVPVQPGFFRFSAHIHVPAGDQVDWLAMLRTYVFDANGTRIQYLSKQFSLNRAVDTWYEIAQTEVLPPGAVSATCRLYTSSTREVYIDDVTITQLQPLPVRWVNAFTETFDTVPVGALPAGWTATDPTAALVQPDGNGHALALGGAHPTDTQTRPGVDAGRGFGAITGLVRASFRIRQSQDRVGVSVHLIDADGDTVLSVSMSSLGRFAYADGDGWGNPQVPYTAGTWYSVQTVLHPDAGTFDVSIDGKLVGTGAVRSTKAPTALRARTNPGLAVGEEGFRIDDVSIDSGHI